MYLLDNHERRFSNSFPIVEIQRRFDSESIVAGYSPSLKKEPLLFPPYNSLKRLLSPGERTPFSLFPSPAPSNDSAFSSDAAGILLDDMIFRKAREKDAMEYIYRYIFIIFFREIWMGWKIISRA